MPLPIVLDTDIGTDIDDVYALLLAASSHEVSLRAVTTVNGDVVIRAGIAKSVLRMIGCGHIPVKPCACNPITTGVNRGWMGHEGQGIDLSGVDHYDFCGRDLEEFLSTLIFDAHSQGTPLTFVSIGPLTNLARVSNVLAPGTISMIGGIISMASSFRGFGPENAQGEHNVACDPEAFQGVISSGVPMTIIGLNVTTQTSMSSADLDRITSCGGSLAETIVRMHHIWFDVIGKNESPMHDPLAVVAAFHPDIVNTIPVTAELPEGNFASGAVVYNAPSDGAVTNLRIATEVNVEAFDRLFFKRIESVVRNRSSR